jgi:hypothetical protein
MESECKACPVGTYAPKLLNYTDWAPLPYGFDNECVPISGDECERSRGWVGTGILLRSPPNIDVDVVLMLSRTVTIDPIEDAYV